MADMINNELANQRLDSLDAFRGFDMDWLYRLGYL